MHRFIDGEDRMQQTLLPNSLEDYVSEENPVRVIEVFIDELDLAVLGFAGVTPAATGRPSIPVIGTTSLGDTEKARGMAVRATDTKPLAPPIAYVYLAVIVVTWAGNWPLLKLALAEAPPLQFVLVRLAGTIALLAPVLLAMRAPLLPVRGERPRNATPGATKPATVGFSMSASVGWQPNDRASARQSDQFRKGQFGSIAHG
jgi:hypothetical protein